ncbi:MAG: rod shape-determining protein MreC [Defluviitaleaceae bacterium]|nr:rod shape-determining protein MreC [Defluviitaleaceae bacterium]
MTFIHRYKRIFLLIGMGICIVAMIITFNPDFRPTVIARSLGYVVVPLQSGATAATNWVTSRVSLLWEMSYLQQENARLRDEIGWLQIENQRLQLAGEEYLRLTELLYIRRRYSELPIVGATIIGHNPSAWNNRFTIDRGSNDGFARNMAVLGDGGLVGVIHQVTPNSSTITSLIDDSFAVAVQSVRTEDTGVVMGDSTLMQAGLVRMEYISTTAQIMINDEIVTSTFSLFPPGISVGTVVEVRPTPDGLAQYAIIRPSANVRRLEHVLVVNQLFSPEDQDAEDLY